MPIKTSNPKEQFIQRLFRPVDANLLAVFRILFGALLAIKVFVYWRPEVIEQLYIAPRFLFRFSLMNYLHIPTWPDSGLYLHFLIMGIAAIAVAIGFFYRAAIITLFLTFSYVVLLDKVEYHEHYYFICLISFLLIFMDAHRVLSFDALRKSSLKSPSVPFWNIFILRAQIIFVYFFAGIAKMTVDWLMRAEPLRMWVEEDIRKLFSPFPLVDPAWIVYGLSWGACLLDLTVGALLLCRRTRLFGFLLLLIFHLGNKYLFGIGIFPYLMIAVNIIFLSPETIRQAVNRVQRFFDIEPMPAAPEVKKTDPALGGRQRLALCFLTIYLLGQLLLPWQHWLYPGWVEWNREGSKFGWRMKLSERISDTYLLAKNPDTGEIFPINVYEDLSIKQASRMSSRPELIWQYAQFIKGKLQKKGIQHPIITAQVRVSINNRPFYQMIDPNVNLAEVDYPPFSHADWILPHPEYDL